MSALAIEQRLYERAKEALGRLAAVRESGGQILIDLPIMYPSGAMVVIQVEQNRDKFWVSDMGNGLLEAEFMGAHEFYSSAATRTAKDFSVEFDGHSIFALWVSSGQLESAIVCVANASAQASGEAIRHAAEVQIRRQNERVFERVCKVFGRSTVARKAEVRGLHTSWEAHNVIVFPNRHRAVFEFMTKHQNSVSNRFFMFNDIRRADEGISLNAVVRSLDDLDEKAQIVGDVANLVPFDAPDDVFRTYARAA